MSDASQPDPKARTRASGTAAGSTGRGKYAGKRLGKFQIVGELGRGGMGVVFEARDTLLDRHVAIKMLPRSVAAQPDALERFLREARAAAQLNHPHVVSVFDADQFNGQYFIVLELVRGGSLQDALKAGPLNWIEATRVLADACRGLEVAHRAGLIHRDIKPANLMRSEAGTVKLADFGLVRPNESTGASMTGSGSVLGTPQFMSPEQCRSERADERSDLYSMGATYFALLTGRPPFPGEAPLLVMNAHLLDPVPDPRVIDPTIPTGCAAIIQRAMAKDPDDRFRDASQLLAALERLIADPEAADPENAAPAAPFTASGSSSPPGSRTISRTNSRTNLRTSSQSSSRTRSLLVADPAAWSRWASVALSWGARRVTGAASETTTGPDSDAADFRNSSPAPSPRSTLDSARRTGTAALAVGVVAGVLALGRWLTGGGSVSDDAASKTRGPGAAHAVSDDSPTGRLPLSQTVRAALPRPVVTLAANAFRLPGMRHNEAASAKGGDVWSVKVPGLSHVLAAQSGEFVVTLSSIPDRVQRDQPNSHVTVWSKTGAVLFDERIAGRATSAAISFDSRRLAVGTDSQSSVFLWNALTWQPEPAVALPGTGSSHDDERSTGRGGVDAVALSDDGRWLAFTVLTEGADGEWVLKGLADQRPGVTQRVTVPGAGRLRSIAFAPDDELLVVAGCDDSRLRFWAGQPLAPYPEPIQIGNPVRDLAIRPEGTLMALSTTRSFALWDYRRDIRTFVEQLKAQTVTCVAFSPDGRQACLSSGPTVTIIDAETHRLIRTVTESSGSVVSLAFLADGSGLFTASDTGTLTRWSFSAPPTIGDGG